MRSIKKLFTFILILFLFLPSKTIEADNNENSDSGKMWEIETIINDGNFVSISLAVDSMKNIHIAYNNRQNEEVLNYGIWNGSALVVREIKSISGRIKECAIVLDSFNRPHICYETSFGGIKYANLDHLDRWNIQNVSHNRTGSLNIKLDSKNRPHIGYWRLFYNHNHSVHYTYLDDDKWIDEEIDAPDVGKGTSFDLDQYDVPHFSYIDMVNESLKYATKRGSKWNIETIDPDGGGGYNDFGLDGIRTSIDVGENGEIFISYNSKEPSGLYFASKIAETWEIELIDNEEENIGGFSKISIDKYQNSIICYYQESGYNVNKLKLAYQSEEGWEITTVDSSESIGWYISMQIDIYNNIHIIYRGNIRSDRNYVKYAYMERMIDDDNDTLPDYWEIQYFGDLRCNKDEDFDSDGLTNYDEFINGTNPNEPKFPDLVEKPEEENIFWIIMVVIIVFGIGCIIILLLIKQNRIKR